MNYELAKKLKEAGFPQELNNGDWAYFTDKDEYTDNEIHLMHDDNDEGCFVGNSYSHRYFDHDPTSWTKVPTLSELIEACGEDLIAIQREFNEFNEFTKFTECKWCAVNEWEDYYPPDVHRGGYGHTPEEAVAHLWLSLNNN